MLYQGMKISRVGQYPAVYMPEHEHANANGYVYVHILVAEKKIGGSLPEGSCIHHVNENKYDYSDMNIWIFKTNADHATYHAALRDNKDFRLICRAGIMECELIISPYVCPICGSYKTNKAKVCLNCCKKEKSSHIPEKEVLYKLLTCNSYASVGRRYGVSGNTVKKWAIKYDIYSPKCCFIPDRDELVRLLKYNSRKKVADIYEVSPGIVKTWEKKLNINMHSPYSVFCVETEEIFENKFEASLKMYPDITKESGANEILKACKTGCAYRNIHWEFARCML